jgi:hypothetical protein
MTPPKHGFYSIHFTAEEITMLDAMPPGQHLEHLKFALLIWAKDLLTKPDLTIRQRAQILTAVKRFIPK